FGDSSFARLSCATVARTRSGEIWCFSTRALMRMPPILPAPSTAMVFLEKFALMCLLYAAVPIDALCQARLGCRGILKISREPASREKPTTKDRRPTTAFYSHSIVPGGFDVMSYTTRLTPWTSFTIRFEIVLRTSCGSGTQSAVMPSSECTARMAQVYAYVRWSPMTPTDITGSRTAKDCQIFL